MNAPREIEAVSLKGGRKVTSSTGSKLVTALLLIVALLCCLAGPAHAATPKVTYYYTDPQGTVLAKADEQGNIISRSDRKPYGEQVMGTPEDGPGYTGHVDDPDSGLVYMQARYYDPQIGRFLSIDPVLPAASDVYGFSRYVYGSNSPFVRTDPTGLSDECSAACRKLRQLADSMGVSGAFRENSGGGSGLLGQSTATLNELNGEAEVSAAGQITAVASSADALPGATFAACMGGGDCTGAEIAAAAAAMLPMEFELGIEANEIIAINKLHADGVVRAGMHVETTIVNMAYREGKLARAAVAIRDIAGSHVFEDGNKRTAYDVAYKLLGGKIDPQKLRGVVADAAIHKINTAEEIEAALDR